MKLIDIPTKARIRGLLVSANDTLRRTPFARQRNDVPQMTHTISLSQPFKPSETLENKKHNLREAASRINAITIRPGEIFSFWHTVGNPNNPKRFAAGRTIHDGVVQLDLGGGLCQASGIIHHIALIAGLEIIERHNLSVDLYTDETRFAPIGTDATVFYGYKDFRFRNNSSSCLRLQLTVEEQNLILNLHSETPLKEHKHLTDIKIMPDGKKHVTLSDAESSLIINESVYIPDAHH